MDRNTLVHRIGQCGGALMICGGVMVLVSILFDAADKPATVNDLFGVGAILSGMSWFLPRKYVALRVVLVWLSALMIVAATFVRITSS